MIRVALASFVVMLSLAPVAHAANDCTSAQMTIGGVSFCASPSDVIAKFGNPRHREKLASEELYDSKFIYSDATVYFLEGKLQYLESSRKGLCTSTGICPGSGSADVRRILGDSLLEPETERESLSCFDTGSACGLVVLLHAGRARGLRLQCQP